MLIRHRGKTPKVAESAWVAPNAVLAGQVSIGEHSRVMYGASLDAEGSHITVGRQCLVCENAVLRATAAGDREYPVDVADHAFVSPQATLLGCRLEQGCYIATGATVLQGAIVGPGAVVAVGALVHAQTELPAEFFLAPGAVALGNPPKIYTSAEAGELVEAIKELNFRRIAFNIDSTTHCRMESAREIALVRSREFAAHQDDEIVG